jgi:hypothetical protein
LNLGVTGIEKSRVGELILKCTRLFLVKMQGIFTSWFNNLALVWSEKPVNLYLATLLHYFSNPYLDIVMDRVVGTSINHETPGWKNIHEKSSGINT